MQGWNPSQRAIALPQIRPQRSTHPNRPKSTTRPGLVSGGQITLKLSYQHADPVTVLQVVEAAG